MVSPMRLPFASCPKRHSLLLSGFPLVQVTVLTLTLFMSALFLVTRTHPVLMIVSCLHLRSWGFPSRYRGDLEADVRMLLSTSSMRGLCCGVGRCGGVAGSSCSCSCCFWSWDCSDPRDAFCSTSSSIIWSSSDGGARARW